MGEICNCGGDDGDDICCCSKTGAKTKGIFVIGLSVTGVSIIWFDIGGGISMIGVDFCGFDFGGGIGISSEIVDWDGGRIGTILEEIESESKEVLSEGSLP